MLITSPRARKIIDNARDLFQHAEMIVKVKEPLPAEFGLLRKGQILFTYLHLAASRPLTEALLKSGVTGVAYETIQVGNRLPLLEPMSEIAGRMSVVMGAYFLAKHNGGNGVLLGRRPGSAAGQGRRSRRRHLRRQCRAHGDRTRRRRDDSRSRSRTDAFSRYHHALRAYPLLERSALAGIDALRSTS